jgi:hypothetical protein
MVVRSEDVPDAVSRETLSTIHGGPVDRQRLHTGGLLVAGRARV